MGGLQDGITGGPCGSRSADLLGSGVVVEPADPGIRGVLEEAEEFFRDQEEQDEYGEPGTDPGTLREPGFVAHEAVPPVMLGNVPQLGSERDLGPWLLESPRDD